MPTQHIDESLARGLKSRFFQEIPEAISHRVKEFSKSLGGKRSRQSWETYAENASSILSNLVLAMYLGGGKRKPYLGICALALGRDRFFKSWTEDYVTSYNFALCFEPKDMLEMDGQFVLGEHAITRLFQRSRLRRPDEPLNAHFILPELSLIPVWASYWAFVFIMFRQKYGIDRITPIIPGATGLFLAECTAENPFVEVRTFVSDDQLQPFQQIAKATMVEAVKHVQSSPMSLGVLTGAYCLDDSRMELMYISHKLQPNVDAITSSLFHYVENDQERMKLKDAFARWISDQADQVVETGLVDAIEQGRLRELHVAYRSEMLLRKISPL